VLVKKLTRLHNDTLLFKREREYAARLTETPIGRSGAVLTMAIKVLIVDDSALMRALLTEIINGARGSRSGRLGARPDRRARDDQGAEPRRADPGRRDAAHGRPRAFLERLMRLRPMPVIMISSFTAAGSEVTLKALELGAVDFLAKPQAGKSGDAASYAEDIRDKIRAAARRAPEGGAACRRSARRRPLRIPPKAEHFRRAC
jgi:two-component system chemotaxis response regulator CheB